MNRPGLLLALLLLLPPALCRAGEPIHLYVNSRAYDVSVAPVDEESKSADSSMLYHRSEPGAAWEEIGECRKERLSNGDVRFTREVEVDRDGVFRYTSRPIVRDAVENPPRPGDPDQAVVVVDTLPPTVEMLTPPDDHKALPGEKVPVRWIVSDENLGETPAVLAYSVDGGASWNLAERDLPAEGGTEWRAPGDLAGPALVRLAARDLAGNVGRALRRVEPKTPAPADIPETATKIVPESPAPDPDAVKGPDEAARRGDGNRSWLYYLMAVNLMRQNKPADALQYYWLSVKEDPDFVNAWADIALAYIDLGAYQTAREVTEQTRDRAPDRIDLVHLLGETYHAEGMELLGRAHTAEDRMRAKGLIDQAVAWYGKALDMAAKEWRLAEQAASFYRLGEVCYYVNLDRDGARAYWRKILSLHSPTPNPDLLLWSSSKDKPKERKRHERYTYQRVSLDAWQNWARGYLEQMDARERAGILDLMPAQRISVPARSLSYAGNAINPGREDGRSLFSLPGQFGGPDDVAACEATAGNSGPRYSVQPNFPAHMNRPPVTDGYSFYASKEAQIREEARPAPARRRRSAFSGGPDPVAVPPPDPYAFPQRGRTQAPWNGAQPYGSQPIQGW